MTTSSREHSTYLYFSTRHDKISQTRWSASTIFRIVSCLCTRDTFSVGSCTGILCVTFIQGPWRSEDILAYVDADLVCARARNHYDPSQGLELAESVAGTESSNDQGQDLKDRFKSEFTALHSNMLGLMYFC